jgi:pyridoxine/pyridoxamine 5'-phosphate oxidase
MEGAMRKIMFGGMMVMMTLVSGCNAYWHDRDDRHHDRDRYGEDGRKDRDDDGKRWDRDINPYQQEQAD